MSLRNTESDHELCIFVAEKIVTRASAIIMVVVPCTATCHPKIPFIVVWCVCPLPDVADHVVAAERAHAVSEGNDWCCCSRAEFCSIAPWFVNFIAPRKESIIGTACSVLPFLIRRQSTTNITGIRLCIFACNPDDGMITSVYWGSCRLSNPVVARDRYPERTVDIGRWLQDRCLS